MYPAVRIAHAQLPADPEARWKTIIPVTADLKVKAKKLGLWNLFLSKAHYPQWGVPLTNLEVSLHDWSASSLLLNFALSAVWCHGRSPRTWGTARV